MSATDVNESVSLHLIDTSQLMEERKKLNEAKRIKAESENILKKSPEKLRKEKELMSRLGIKGDNKSGKIKPQLTFSGSPIESNDINRDPVLPRKRTSGRKEAITGASTNSAFRDMQKKITDTEKKQKDFERKQKEFKKTVSDIQNDITDKIGSANDILASGMGVGAASGILSKFGPIGIIAASVFSTMYIEFSKQFERGGVFSIFLKQDIQTSTITDAEELNLVRSGTKFLTSDLRIVQGEPRESNTQNIKYEHVRFVSQNLGA